MVTSVHMPWGSSHARKGIAGGCKPYDSHLLSLHPNMDAPACTSEVAMAARDVGEHATPPDSHLTHSEVPTPTFLVR